MCIRDSYFIKVLRQETPTSIPSFNEYKYSQFITNITQDNDYVILTADVNPPIRPNAGYNVGYWNKVYTATGFFWQLSIPDYDDNGVNTLTVSEVDSDGIAIKLSGVYTEAGFYPPNATQLPPNPTQLPSVGGVTYTKITYK